MQKLGFRRYILIFLVLCLVFPFPGGWGLAQTEDLIFEEEPVTVKEDSNLRESPSLSAPILAQLPQGSPLLILEEGTDDEGRIWFYVKTDSGEGWLASWLLNFGQRRWAVVDAELVNVREGPGMEFEVIDQVSWGTVLFIRGEEEDSEGEIWYKIYSDSGLEGFIASWLTRPGRVSEPPPIPVEIATDQGTIVLWDIYYHWGKEEIVSQVKTGLVEGYPDQTFRPDNPITRGEFYTLLVRLMGLPLQSPPSGHFLDLPSEHWAYSYLETALGAGYLGPEPYPTNIFPDQAITRQEIAQAAVRALGLEEIALSRLNAHTTFTDTIPSEISSYLQVAEESGIIRGYPDGTFGPERGATRAESLTVLERLKNPTPCGTIYLAQKTVTLSASKAATVDYVVVDLAQENIFPRVYIAKDRVGCLESLESLAGGNGVTVAIPAAYFDKKCSDPLNPDGPFRYIWGNLENDGTFITLTNEGTSVGFTDDKKVLFAPLEVGITGRIIPENLDGRTPEDLSFYVSGLNQPLLPDSVRIFTPIYGPSVNVGEAKAMVFKQYKVVEIKSGEVEIPHDGFVLAAPAGSWLYAHFRLNDRVELQYKYTNNVTGELLLWHEVKTTISGGPRLLAGGKIALNSGSERFDDSLLPQTARRTALGLIGSSTLILANVMEPVTLEELAKIMQDLGCSEALNLDGGASCGLYYKGKVINTPKGSLTNILAFHESF